MYKSTTHNFDMMLNAIALESVVRVLITTLNEEQSALLSKSLTSIWDEIEAGATDQTKDGLKTIRDIVFDIANNPFGNFTNKN